MSGESKKKENKIAATQFWYGENQSLLQWELGYWCEEFHKRHPEAVIEKLARGESDLLPKLERSLKSAGLFAQKKLVILYNLMAKSDDVSEFILANITKISPDIFVIIVEGNKLNAASKLAKQIKKMGQDGLINIKEYGFLGPRELESWITKQIKVRQAKISASAVSLLASLLGENYLRLDQEINKLVAYANGQEIKNNEVDVLVAQILEENVFAVIDALGRRDFKIAVRGLEEQFAMSVSPQSLVGTLAWHLRTLWQIRQYVDKHPKAPAREIATDLGLHPYVVNKSLAQLPYYNKERLKILYNELSDLDVKLKSTPLDQQMLFDLFISRLANMSLR